MAKKPAVRVKVPLRMLLDGYEGSGKTFTALRVMTYLIGDKPIALIDTERNRALLYAPLPGQEADPEKGTFNFWHYPVPDGDPKSYKDAINEALADGAQGIIIDSITHEWDGENGILAQKTKLDQTGRGNSYTNWSTMTAKHNEWLNFILTLPVPMIATGRVHQDHVIEEEGGKRTVRKAGLNLIQRDTTGYEFDFIARMERGGILTVTKAPNLGQIQDKTFVKPGLEFATFLNEWLGLGAELPLTRDEFAHRMRALGYKDNDEIAAFTREHSDIKGKDRYSKWLELAQKKAE